MSVIVFNRMLDIPGPVLSGISLFVAMSITYFAIPSIITVARKKQLFASPNGRTSHTENVPTLGGMAIYAGLMISVTFFIPAEDMVQFRYIIAASIILFFTGIKDDILLIDPKKKLILQLVAAALIIIPGDMRITSFQGFAGIYELPYLLSVIFTLFVFIVVINGFNLIDGIDGLASGIAIITSLTFGTWFLIVRQLQWAILSFSLAGSLLAFYRFNVFSRKNKIFLGDTGSLSIGLMLSVIVVQFLQSNLSVAPAVKMSAAPALSFGILIVPLFDTLRVFTLRILNGESPFLGDRKHIHHRLLDLGFSHRKASATIIMTNMAFIGMAFLLQKLGNMTLLFILLSTALAFSYLPVYLFNRQRSRIMHPVPVRRVLIPEGRKERFKRTLPQRIKILETDRV